MKKNRSILLLLPLIGISFTSCTSPRETETFQEQEAILERLVNGYMARLPESAPSIAETSAPIEVAALPVAAEPGTVSVGLQDLIIRALAHSSQIKVFSELPLIRETAIQEADSFYDPEFFTDARYYDRDDPVGSTLTTGQPGRFIEYDTRISAGVRTKFSPGTEVYLTQDLYRTRNNSEFFEPNPQAGAKLTLGLIQPLLDGAGARYNNSVIEIAKIDTDIAENEFLRQLQAHILEITRTYWGLHMALGIQQVKANAVADASAILDDFEARGGFDANRPQILRVRAVAAERRADLIRAEGQVRNTTERLKALVNDPNMIVGSNLQLVPGDLPVTALVGADLRNASVEALQNRPEVQQAYLQMQSAAIRRDMARTELLPSLNLLAETYVAGIAEDDVNKAYDNQYDGNGPGYMFGLRFELPLGNNQAEALSMRRRLELRQLEHQLQTTMETVLLDVQIAAREVDIAYRDMIAKHESVQAATEELDSLLSRRDAMFLGAEGTAVTYLNQLLDAQDRRNLNQERLLQSVSAYNLALTTLARAQGTLLQVEDIEIERFEDKDQDELRTSPEDRTLPRLQPRIAQ